MKIINNFFDNNVMLFSPDFKPDKRGLFYESFNDLLLKKINFKNFPQENIIFSKKKYTFRGIHIQSKNPQAKILHILRGDAISYVVDLRKNSLTFGNYIKVKLLSQQHLILFISEGFGHGLLTLNENVLIKYKVSKKYSKNHSINIAYDDKDINIKIHPLIKKKLLLSDADKKGISLNDYKRKFIK